MQRDLIDGRLVRLCPDWVPPRITLSLADKPGVHHPRRVLALRDGLKQVFTRTEGSADKYLQDLGVEEPVHFAGAQEGS